MRRIVFAICTTITGLVLLFSWPTSLNRAVTPAASAGGGTTGTSSGTSSGTAAGTSTGTTSGTTSGTASSTTPSTTYDGATASTQWGDVQVRITVAGGKVSAAEAIVYPDQNPHDQQINAYAIPTLNQEATAAGSASINLVSGATVTSNGYVQSLQSALDQAGL
ncbi:FMN-binding protein [Pengzhenrongella sp.]|jgi:uncharacterized protein with FMN-binding domain|uniref:FMN-binding protein n=1 Tax=Pengzhenrongella sp. TaxID=2888820 RepID=UPI002F957FB7